MNVFYKKYYRTTDSLLTFPVLFVNNLEIKTIQYVCIYITKVIQKAYKMVDITRNYCIGGSLIDQFLNLDFREFGDSNILLTTLEPTTFTPVPLKRW